MMAGGHAAPGARRVRTGSVDDVSGLGLRDVRTTWEQALARTPGHLVTQTPHWLSAILDGSGWHDRTRIYERPQGRALVVPLVGRGAGRVAVGGSWPHGWGSGGVLASDGRVTAEDLTVVMEDLRAGAAARVVVHPHPLQRGWDALGTGSHLHSRYLTHVLDLSSGRAGVWAGYSTNVRRSIRRAESSGVEVVRDEQGALLPTFAALHGLSMERWAQAKGRSTRVARLHGRVEEPRRRLQSIAAALGTDCVVYGAFLEGRPVAAIVVLHGVDHSVYWRGAMDRELAARTHANALLHHTAIEEALCAGYTSYSFGESDEGSDLARYKAKFGAAPVRWSAYRVEGLPVTAGLRAAERLAVATSRTVARWAQPSGGRR